MAKRLIVYDLDGTLVDTAEDITEAANHMLSQLSARPMSREAIRGMVGRGLHDLVQRCLGTQDEGLILRGTQLFSVYYAAHLDTHSRLYVGARDTLDHFSSRTQAVFTNKPQPFARDLLVKLGIAHYFVDVLAPSPGQPKKPDPAQLLQLMERLGIAPAETVFIGDSLIDWHTSRNAGVEALLLTHGFEDHEQLRRAAPSALMRDFGDVLQHAKQSQW